MSLHAVIGAGPIGSAAALLLAETGEEVRLVSRSGRAPQHPGIRAAIADAQDAAALRAATSGANVIYNCVNPPYTRWVTDWPPIAASILVAAETHAAVLVTMGNLYGYGPVDHPMTESDPLSATFRKGQVRAQMWRDALAAHATGRIRATEARASDYFGPGVGFQSVLGRASPRLLAGKPASVFGNLDTRHSWTYVPDIAKALIVLGSDERAWGKAWHVPTSPPLTQRALLAAAAEAAGAAPARVRSMPAGLLRLAGAFVPILRELEEVSYQFDRDFVVDSSAFSETFGLAPTPMATALQETVAAARETRR